MNKILPEKSVIVAISHFGRNKALIDMLNLAKKRYITIIGITIYFKSPLSKILDLTIYTPETKLRNERNSILMNIMLIGFMGTGKTSIAKELSAMLSMDTIDIDLYIEKKECMSISKIFKQYGEYYFRDLERDALAYLSKKNNVIISCGGGIVLREENIQNIKQNSFVILLKASPETIYDRLKNDTSRPLLENNITLNSISDLMKSREHLYKNASDISFYTDNKTIYEVCQDIHQNIRLTQISKFFT